MDGNFHRRVVLEEHIILVQEPGSDHLDHVAARSGSANNIKQNVTACVQVKCSESDGSWVHCDGTAVNTRNKGGVIQLIEHLLSNISNVPFSGSDDLLYSRVSCVLDTPTKTEWQ